MIRNYNDMFIMSVEKCFGSKVVLYYFLFITRIMFIETSIRILDKGVLPLEKNSIAIQFFLDVENQDKLNTCKLCSRSNICCLSDNEVNCNLVEVYGGYNDVLKPKYRDTILYIYPAIIQYDQVGYCTFGIDYRCGTKKSKRELVKIPFDTRLSKKSHYLLKEYCNGQVVNCDSLDEDSLNQCCPVQCDMKYSGCRPFYNINTNKCEKSTECFSNTKQELPDVVYDPKSNTCRDLNNPLTVADIYAISTGLGTVVEPINTEEIGMELRSNCTTISENLMFLRDLLYGKLFATKTNFSESCNKAIISIITSICGLSLGLLLFVFSLYLAGFLFKKWKSGGLGNIVSGFKKKFRKSATIKCRRKMSKPDDEVRNKLLREVIVSDLPLELRDDVIDICDRIHKEMNCRRQNVGDTESHVNFERTYDTSITSD